MASARKTTNVLEKLSEFKYSWNIKNLSYTEHGFESPIFGCEYYDHIKWTLKLELQESIWYVRPHLVHNEHHEVKKLKCSFKISLICKQQNTELTISKHPKPFFRVNDVHPVALPIDRYFYAQHTLYDSLLICCDMTVLHITPGLNLSAFIDNPDLCVDNESLLDCDQKMIDILRSVLPDQTSIKPAIPPVVQSKSNEKENSGDLSRLLETGTLPVVQSKSNENENSGDLSRLLETGNFSDVILVVGDTEFHAHKNILTHRSDFFASMFEDKSMKENHLEPDETKCPDQNSIRKLLACVYSNKLEDKDKNTLDLLATTMFMQKSLVDNILNRFEIKDIDPQTFRKVLAYIYSAKVEDKAEITSEFIGAINKYAVKHLQNLCDTMLELELSNELAIPTLILADRQSADALKLRAMKFIKLHISDIAKTNEWSSLNSNYLHLVIEIVKCKETE